MAVSFQITSNGIKVRDSLGRIATNLPKAVNKDLRTVTQLFCTEWRKTQRKYKLGWHGDLFRRTKPIKTSKGYSVRIPKYGLQLEFRKGNRQGYYVGPDTKGRAPLARWITERIGFDPGFIFVHFYPWFTEGKENARMKIKEKLKTGHVHKLIESKGGST